MATGTSAGMDLAAVSRSTRLILVAAMSEFDGAMLSVFV